MKKTFIVFLFSFSILVGGATEDSDDIKASYLKSYDYEKMNQYSEAIKILAPLYAKYPKGYMLNLRLGWLFYLDRKYMDAIQYYQKALLVNTYSLEPKLGLIKVYLDTSEYHKAMQMSYEIIKTDYYNYYGNLYMAKALIAKKEYANADKVVKKMLLLYPTDVVFLQTLAMNYKATDNTALSQLYQDILILDPNNIFVRSNIGK